MGYKMSIIGRMGSKLDTSPICDNPNLAHIIHHNILMFMHIIFILINFGVQLNYEFLCKSLLVGVTCMFRDLSART